MRTDVEVHVRELRESAVHVGDEVSMHEKTDTLSHKNETTTAGIVPSFIHCIILSLSGGDNSDNSLRYHKGG